MRLGVARLCQVRDRNAIRNEGSAKMAKIIQFYIPNNFRKSGKWIPQENRGKIIEFTLAAKKTA